VSAVASPEALEPGARDALKRLVFSLADTKRVLGIRYSDWLLGAPSIEMGIAASAMAQDEWGHARLLYALLKEFGLDPVAVEHERPAGEYCSLDCLDEPFDDWADFVAAVVVADGMLSVALEAMMEGGYEPSAGRIQKMLAEEEFHADLGRAWFRRIAAGTEEGRGRLAEASRRMVPAALTCLAPDDDSARLLVQAGLMPAAHDLRARFWQRWEEVLGTVGIDPGATAADGTAHQWDATRSRGEGEPDAETVERARGDRNRALFVE
jgi:phenylacetate-CoA oxygenase PaaI subunit